MAEERGDPTDNTEEPTHRKLEEAQKKGQVVSSREVNHWFMILASTIVIAMFGLAMTRDVGRILEKFIALPHAIPADIGALRELLLALLAEIGLIVLVPIVFLIVAAFGASFVQHGFVLATDLLRPKLERISISSGARRLFSLQALTEFTKGVVKITIVSAAVIALLWSEFHSIERVASFEMAQLLALTRDLVLRAMVAILAIVSVVAAADFLYQRAKHMREMRMSRREIKEEYKQTEGDPHVKGRLRQLRRERSKRRMMANVPTATVVVTNPTHYAVALRYEMDKMAAPIVVAKGVDALARRIREVAEAHRIPLVQNPPLAQALHASVEIDEEIPPAHYKAVADVISYVLRLQGKLRPVRPREPVPRPS